MARSYRVFSVTGVIGAALLAVTLGVPGTLRDLAAADDAPSMLQQAEELAAHHRYQEVVDLLGPLVESPTAPAATPESVLELGRAYFHLGRYNEAYDAFKRATEARPAGSEGLEYLEASAYLLDRKDEALALLERVLASGRTDLVLALTLPGERAFLRDPAVWQVLKRYARRLDISLVQGTVMGFPLGTARAEVEQALQDVPRQLDDPDGPASLEVLQLRFSDDGRLAGLALSAEDLLRYTPFRLGLDDGLGWGSAPDEAVERYGAPTTFVPQSDGGVRLTWTFQGWSGTLGFGPPRLPRPAPIGEGRAMLREVELHRAAPIATR